MFMRDVRRKVSKALDRKAPKIARRWSMTNARNIFEDLQGGSLCVDPSFKIRKGLRNNEQELATVSSRFLDLNLCCLC